MFKRTETILFILFTASFDIFTLLQVNGDFILYSIAQFALGFLLVVTFIYSIWKILSNRRPIPLLKKLAPTSFGLFLIATIPIFGYLVDSDGGKKIILSATSGGGVGFVQLDLRDDGSFKLTNSGPLGGKFYRGHYLLQNDTLCIDNGDKNLYPTLSFVLRDDTASKKRYLDPIPTDTSKESYYRLYITERSIR